jgi:hypothetical protein
MSFRAQRFSFKTWRFCREFVTKPEDAIGNIWISLIYPGPRALSIARIEALLGSL